MNAIDHTQSLFRFINRVVGTPFKDKGRDLSGLDCWGVVWLAHKLAGNELPLHGEATFRNIEDAAAHIGGASGEGWLLLKPGTERLLDMAVLAAPVKSAGKWVRLECHVGLVTMRGWLLHCEQHTGVVHVPFEHPSVKRRIARSLRHEAFA